MSDWGFVKFSILMGCVIGAAASVEPVITKLTADTILSFMGYITNLCCCLPAMIGGAGVVSLTLSFEKGSTMRTGQAALVGLLAGIVAVPAYYACLVLIDVILATLVMIKLQVPAHKIDFIAVVGGLSLIQQLFKALFFAPFALVFTTLGATLSLHLFHKGRINRA